MKKTASTPSGKPAELAVFIPTKAATCSECGAEIEEFLYMERDKALCLICADMNHLVYLPRGDAALSRRARKYSGLSALVLHWSRRRKQYERQGILVEEQALDRAELECVMDADKRAHNRQRAQVRNEIHEAAYLDDFTRTIRALFPSCPEEAASTIARHACQKHSGRVGRSAAAKEFSPKTIELAVQAHIRHCHTSYDHLLTQGVPRREARDCIYSDVISVMDRWKIKRQ